MVVTRVGFEPTTAYPLGHRSPYYIYCSNMVINEPVCRALLIKNRTCSYVSGQPGIPSLQVLFDGIEGNTANFKCTGEVGDPKGYLDIESKFDGSNFTTFLSSRDGSDQNESGSITSTTDITGECSTIRTINFKINRATSKYHNKLLKCISKPSLSLEDGTAAESDAEVIEVIPGL